MLAEIVFPETNAALVVAALKNYGVTNPYLQAASLAILWKESRIQAGRENMNYGSVERLRFVFQSAFKNKPDSFVQQYVKQPEKLANYVYGGKYGNTGPNDGWLYRGGGMNGITFKSGYERYGKLSGYDLVGNPDLLRDPAVSADVVAAYNKDQLKFMPKYMGIQESDVKDIATAVRAIMRVTAGWGNSVEGNIFKEGEKKALEVAPQMYNFVRKLSPEVIDDLDTDIEITRLTKKQTRRRILLASAAIVALAGGTYVLTNKRAA